MRLAGIGHRNHPYTTDWLRYVLARRTLPQLVLLFVALLIVLSLVLGIAYQRTSPGEPGSLLRWWHEAFMVLTTIPLAEGVAESDDWPRRIVQAVTATAGLVLPALFLGSIVFKLLLAPDVFVFRKQIALNTNPDPHDILPKGGRHLAIRVYSSTRLQLLDLRATVVLRIRTEQAESGPVELFRAVVPANPEWPLGEKHVPHTLRIKLEDDEVDVDADGKLKLTKICGHSVKDGDRLIVQITGTTPDLGTTFVESHTFDLLGSVSTDPFTGITVEDGVKSRKWKNFRKFDE